MAVDKIKHTKPASQRTFLDELEPIPYTITPEEIAAMNPRMQEVLFGIKPEEKRDKPYTPPPIPEDSEEELAPVEEVSVEPVTPAAPEFDYAGLADFSNAPNPHITLIFPAEEEEKELVEIVRSLGDYRSNTVEGRLWHAARFFRNDSEKLKKINEFLNNRDGIFTLMNGKRTPYGRSLYLPLMYIFSAGKYV